MGVPWIPLEDAERVLSERGSCTETLARLYDRVRFDRAMFDGSRAAFARAYQEELRHHSVSSSHLERLLSPGQAPGESDSLSGTRRYRVPEDFDAETYVRRNPDLRYLTSGQSLAHFLTIGQIEGRRYSFSRVPRDFDASAYRALHEDLRHLSDDEARIHYEEWGHAEGRAYKLDRVPRDFDASAYRALHQDLRHLSDDEAVMHYNEWGYSERRAYKDSFGQKRRE
jgi:hypothetical protein